MGRGEVGMGWEPWEGEVERKGEGGRGREEGREGRGEARETEKGREGKGRGEGKCRVMRRGGKEGLGGVGRGREGDGGRGWDWKGTVGRAGRGKGRGREGEGKGRGEGGKGRRRKGRAGGAFRQIKIYDYTPDRLVKYGCITWTEKWRCYVAKIREEKEKCDKNDLENIQKCLEVLQP